MPTTLHENRPLRGSAWSRCKNPWFFAISKVPARPSAGIGVVDVQKLEVFCDFCGDPLRGSAWSRCKNPWFVAISNMPARPSAGIGVVEVQKPMFFCDFCGARATLCGDRRGRGAKTHVFFCDFCGARAILCGDRRGRGAKTRGFLRFLRCSRNHRRGRGAYTRGFLQLLLFELVLGSCLVVCAPAPGTGVSRVRFLPGPRAGVARCNLHFKATCAEQLAQSKLHRATCADQLAPTSLERLA